MAAKKRRKKQTVRKTPYKTLTKSMAIKGKRVFWIMYVMCIVAVALIIGYNCFSGEKYAKEILKKQSYSNQEIQYKRGDILDANGNVLAVSKKLNTIILEPQNIIYDQKKVEDENGNVTLVSENKNEVKKALKKYMGMMDTEFDEIMENENSYYEVYRSDLPEAEVEELKKYLLDEGKNLKGIYINEEYKRSYPNGTLACHAIGFVSDGEVGTGGLEQYYNNTLKGINGRKYTYLDQNNGYSINIEEAVNGDTIISTLDVNIQKIAEKYLKRFQKSYGSLNTSVLVMNPNNGEVLAMANSHTYDLENPAGKENLLQYYSESELKKMTQKEKSQILTNEIWNNYIISNTFEPGSTFKPFTVAMALETGNVKDEQYFVCNGGENFDGTHVACAHYHGTIPLSDTIALSCNDAMMQMAATMGKETFVEYQKRFGFGSYTDIDLSGEASASSVLHGADMADIDLGISSFGQSFQCTMIQLGAAFCSLVNGGEYYQPHMVKQILDEDGNVKKNIEKTLVKKTVSQETSEKLKSYMLDTVEKGTAKAAKILEYDIGGKTGTAEKYPRGTDKRLVSFIGFAPNEHPELMVYVTIDEIQKGSQSNTKLAVEMTRNILEKSLKYLEVPEKEQKDKED